MPQILFNFEFDIPEKVSTNVIYAGVHWATRKRHKDLWGRSVIVGLSKHKKPTVTYPIIMSFQFKFKGTVLDSSNCSYMAKIIEDWLVKKNIILGDSPKYVSMTWLEPLKGDKDCVIVQGIYDEIQ